MKQSLPGDSVISVDIVLGVVSSKNYFLILKRVSLGDIGMKIKYYNLRPFYLKWNVYTAVAFISTCLFNTWI